MDSDQQDGTNNYASIYKNHPLGPNTTRVVRIVPPEENDATDTISLRLGVISLDPPAKYRALSYEWGDPSVAKVILVDGQPFSIRINLWHFLVQMRKEQYWDPLWIDAVCINQDDTVERSEQVTIMGDIYSKATDVRAWLGLATGQIKLGMRRLNEIGWLELHNFFLLGIPYNRDLIDDEKPEPQQLSATDQKDHYSRRLLSVTTDEFLAPISEFLISSYWSRLWIVQEFILAQRLAIQCEDILVDAEVLEHFTHFMIPAEDFLEELTNFPDTESFQDWLNTPNDTRKLVMDFSTPNGNRKYLATWLISRKSRYLGGLDQTVVGFAEMVHALDRSACADFHDYVYAVRSLNAFAFDNIVPDYTKSRLQLFVDATALLANAYKESYDKFWAGTDFHVAAVSLQRRLQLSDDCDEVRKALATIPDSYRLLDEYISTQG